MVKAKSSFAYVSGLSAVVLLAGLAVWRFGHLSAPSQPVLAKVRIGIIPISDCAQVYIAKYRGLFNRHGLDAELVPLAGGAAILQSLSAGAIDVAFSNLASVVFYQSNAGPLSALAGGTVMNRRFSEAGLVVRADSGIEGLGDLRGKTIAVNTRRNIVDLAVIRALRLNGISSSEVKLIELPFRDMEAALRGSRIDAATLPEPILSRALAAEGLRNLGDHYVLAVGEMHSTGYFTLPSRLSSEAKGLYDRFNTAIREATPIANAYGVDAIGAISQGTGVPENDLRQAGRPLFVGETPQSAVEQMRTWLREEGFLER